MDSMLGTNVMVQVGFIVKDIEKSKKMFEMLLGVEASPVIHATGGAENFQKTRTLYRGKECPNGDAKLAFFSVGGVMEIELIEPNQESSVWREYLEEHGEGLQHIAFVVDSIPDCLDKFKEIGVELMQSGDFVAGDGRYAYVDTTKDFHTVIELLERWNKA